MEEKNVTVDGVTYQLPKPFNVIATQNPIGSYGTQVLPQSQMDRFMIKTSIGYPDFDSQVEILRDRQMAQPLDEVSAIMSREDLIKMQQEVKQVHVAEEVLKYITSLTESTRNHELIVQGISPRGALSLSRIAKAHAYVLGRDYVIPEDVIELFIDTCSHRIILNPRAQGSNTTQEAILLEILKNERTPDIQEMVKV